MTRILLILLCFFCAPLLAANCAWWNQTSNNYYDLSPAYTGIDFQVPADASKQQYWFAPCHFTAKCNDSSRYPVTASTWCNLDTFGTLHGCGVLNGATWSEISPAGSGVQIYYIGGDPTNNGPRTFTLTCSCSTLSIGKISPVAGWSLYEQSTGNYFAEFQSKHCCPVY